MSDAKTEAKNDNNVEGASKVSGRRVRQKHLRQAEFSCRERRVCGEAPR